MKYESVRSLKEEILGEIDKKLGVGTTDTEFESLRGLRPENRIAVGYSQITKNNFRLELRIQRRDQWAFRFAQEVVEETRGETNFEIIPKIEIPSGRETKETTACTPIVNRPEPLQIGLSIGTRDSGIGTLGAFLSHRNGEYVLSCNHVMVSGMSAQITRDTAPGDRIYHPGREKGYLLGADRQIASLSNYIPYSRTEENEVDCAIAQLDSGWGHDGTQIPKNSGYPNQGQRITVMHDEDQTLQRDMMMCKIGRTTCYTRGVLRAIDLDRVPVNVPGEGILLFKNVIEIRSLTTDTPFSLAGDSGSLVFTEDGLEAVGLVFSGGWREDGYKVTYVCKLNPILQWANAELLN